jgi:hypothetical protein
MAVLVNAVALERSRMSFRGYQHSHRQYTSTEESSGPTLIALDDPPHPFAAGGAAFLTSPNAASPSSTAARIASAASLFA